MDKARAMLVGEMTTLVSSFVFKMVLNISNPNPLWANVISDESWEDELAGKLAEGEEIGVGILMDGDGKAIGDGEGVGLFVCGLVWYQYNP